MAKRNKKIIWRAPFPIPVASDYKSAIVLFIKHVEIQLKRKNTELKKIEVSPKRCNEYLECIVETEYAAMSRKLEQKHNDDITQINQAIERRKSDKTELQNLISEITSEMKSLSFEYIKLEELYRNQNPLYKGRLNVDGLSFSEKEEDGDSDE